MAYKSKTFKGLLGYHYYINIPSLPKVCICSFIACLWHWHQQIFKIKICFPQTHR